MYLNLQMSSLYIWKNYGSSTSCARQNRIRNVTKMHRPLALSTKDKIEVNGRDKDLVDYFAIGKEVVVVSDDFEAFSREKVYQIMMGCYKEEYAQALDGVKGAEITAWWDRAVDIIPAGGSKGVAVENLQYRRGNREICRKSERDQEKNGICRVILFIMKF